jgi:hypothetical protein
VTAPFDVGLDALESRFMSYLCLCGTSVLRAILGEYVLFDSKEWVKQTHARVKLRKLKPLLS